VRPFKFDLHSGGWRASHQRQSCGLLKSIKQDNALYALRPLWSSRSKSSLSGTTVDKSE
jgi:hypothetical protein